jgi:putative ABC transport system ATP-binding protein
MIEINGLNKSYGEKEIFKKFNYKINDATLLAIVGKSGSGKSTLLNILGLLDRDYHGDILYNGENIAKRKESKVTEFIRQNINYLFQNYALVDNETVEYNLLLALEYEKMSKKEKISKVSNALKLVDLNEFNNKKIYTLSGGEQQRVALARIILKKGNIILADEPTGNLDYNNSLKVMNILKNLQQQGKTIVIVTHNENLALECDEIIRL